MKYNTFRILILWLGRKSMRAKKKVLIPTKVRATSDIDPPYCLKILLGISQMYRKKRTSTPRMRYPYGFLYFELERNKKYIAKIELARTKTKTSFRKPIERTLMTSKTLKLAVVMGWKKNITLMIKEIIR